MQSSDHNIPNVGAIGSTYSVKPSVLDYISRTNGRQSYPANVRASSDTKKREKDLINAGKTHTAQQVSKNWGWIHVLADE